MPSPRGFIYSIQIEFLISLYTVAVVFLQSKMVANSFVLMICIYDFLCLIFEQSEFTNAAYETMIVVPNTSKKGLLTRQGSCTPDGRCKKLNVYTIKNLCMSLKSQV